MKFLKISEQQYYKDNMDSIVDYEDIIIPKRATKGSAGYNK